MSNTIRSSLEALNPFGRNDSGWAVNAIPLQRASRARKALSAARQTFYVGATIYRSALEGLTLPTVGAVPGARPDASASRLVRGGGALGALTEKAKQRPGTGPYLGALCGALHGAGIALAMVLLAAAYVGGGVLTGICLGAPRALVALLRPHEECLNVEEVRRAAVGRFAASDNDDDWNIPQGASRTHVQALVDDERNKFSL